MLVLSRPEIMPSIVLGKVARSVPPFLVTTAIHFDPRRMPDLRLFPAPAASRSHRHSQRPAPIRGGDWKRAAQLVLERNRCLR